MKHIPLDPLRDSLSLWRTKLADREWVPLDEDPADWLLSFPGYIFSVSLSVSAVHGFFTHRLWRHQMLSHPHGWHGVPQCQMLSHRGLSVVRSMWRVPKGVGAWWVNEKKREETVHDIASDLTHSRSCCRITSENLDVQKRGHGVSAYPTVTC